MLELLGVRDDLLVDELPDRGDDLVLDLGESEPSGRAWSCSRPSRRRRPVPGRHRCTSSPVRIGPRAGAVRAPASPACARRSRRPDGRARCPSPCTLVRSRSAAVNFHSRITASACAAKASFSSMRSMSASVRPALRQRHLGGGHRADAHDLRRHSRDAPGDQPDQRRQPQFGGLLRRGDDAHATPRRSARWSCPPSRSPPDRCRRRMGLSLPSDSTEVSARGCSSVSIDLDHP